MSPPALAALGAVALVLAVVARDLASCAARLHRLHLRVGSSRATLDAALARRADAVRALAACGALPPAGAAVLTAAADRATPAAGGHADRHADRDADREAVESALSRALRAVLTEPVVRAVHAAPGGGARLADLAAACQRVVLARGFANDAVSAARRLRRTRRVRWARLAGSAPLPRTFDVDDEPPALAPVPVAERDGAGTRRVRT